MEELEPPKARLTKAEKRELYRDTYDEPLKSRREELKAVMNGDLENREIRLRRIFFRIFEEDMVRDDRNVFNGALELFEKMPDRTKNNESNLAFNHLRCFKSWLEGRDDADELRKKYINHALQVKALNSLSGVQQYSRQIHELFELDKTDMKAALMDFIHEKIIKNQFKEACNVAIQNNMTDCFSWRDIVMPLVLQDLVEDAQRYLKTVPKMQKEFLRFLDDLIGHREEHIDEQLKDYLDGGKRKMIRTPNTARFVGKQLEKYIGSLITIFDVNREEYAPKYAKNQFLKGIWHHVGTRYESKNNQPISDTVYVGHITSVFEQSTDERIENFLHGMWDSNSEDRKVDALSWVYYYKLDLSSTKLPNNMRRFLRENSRHELITRAKELVESRTNFELVSPDKSIDIDVDGKKINVIMVTNNAELGELCSKLKFYEQSSDDKFVGIDTEWKPSHLIKESCDKIAIIQLYFDNNVYIVDYLELCKEAIVVNETWSKFTKYLFCKKLNVIGFDLINDIKAFLEIGAIKDLYKIEDFRRVWCLKRLTENVCDIDMAVLGLEKKTFKLADLTQTLIGFPLNKSEQCSNWASRPLRVEQVQYAAMDAYIVIEIFDKVVEGVRNSEYHDRFNQLFEESNVLTPKKESTKKENKKLNTMKWSEFYEILRNHRDPTKPLQRPFEIKVIVDTMLAGFGKNLRRIGIDVMIPTDINDLRKKLGIMTRLGGKKQRYLLTIQSKKLDEWRKTYPSHTIIFPELVQKPAIEQLVDFFDRFNIDVREEDEMIRCVSCNSRYQVAFPSPVIELLHKYNVVHMQNVYQPDMATFDLDGWFRKLQRLNPAEYQGIEVEMSRPTPTSDWIIATTHRGNLDITRNTVMHDNCPDGVEVEIDRVPDDEFQRPNLVFYLCGNCGKVNYDGRKTRRELKAEASDSNTSFN